MITVQCLRVLTPSPLSLTGMVIRPKGDEYYEIKYSTQNTESWDMYAQTLEKFLSRKSGLFTSKSLLWIIQLSRMNCILPDKRLFLYSGLEIAFGFSQWLKYSTYVSLQTETPLFHLCLGHSKRNKISLKEFSPIETNAPALTMSLLISCCYDL